MNSKQSISLLIIVPTLDSYHLLSNLLDSLQAQSWPFWRLLFVDGPSGPTHRSWLEACCVKEPRCSWVEQDPAQPYIFGAMNHGFALAKQEDWLLFWGSDDIAAGPDVLASVITTISNFAHQPELLVCRGRYFDGVTSKLGRRAKFLNPSNLNGISFRRALFFGSTPPHQATIFGPKSHSKISSYSSQFRLSSDLDYFLRLSRLDDLSVSCIDLDLVHMSDGGVSGQQTQLRLLEVARAYQRAFSYLWLFPFVCRYIRRLLNLALD